MRYSCTIPGVLTDAETVVSRLLSSRGATSATAQRQFLSPDYERDTHDPFLFTAMEAAVERIRRARDTGETIGIYGDYDADGVCGATLLAEVLSDLGIAHEVYIPHKEHDGHGLSLRAVERFAQRGVGLIVTVDCGITNCAEVAAARSRGMETIIIDHHHVPKVLPDAVAIINPQLPDSGYPFAQLCGTGTAFKVAQALYTRLAPERVEQTKWLLDLVAIATVADCMPLIEENRVLVQYGLVVLRKTRRPGLHALFDVARISHDTAIDAEVIAFRIAPRINAAGRMDHAQQAYELLSCRTAETATKHAAAIEELNTQRRSVSATITADARSAVHAMKEIPAGIVVGSSTYFHGVVGLAAARLAEEFRRPVGVFHHMGETSLGSFRSRDGVHIVDILREVQRRVDEAVFVKYGGHAAAAGATIRTEHFEQFAETFAQVAAEYQPTEDDAVISADACIALSAVTPELVKALRQMAPFGIGNPEPVFIVPDIRLQSFSLVGNKKSHARCVFSDGRQTVAGIGFSLADTISSLRPEDTVTLSARVRENIYHNTRSIQLVVEDIANDATLKS